MLIRLGRWLRAAGYDTALADESSTDKSLVNQAIKENRVLITRDRKLLEIRHADNVTIYLNCNDTEQCLEELSKKCKINWLLKPFSRCMNCNYPLKEAEKHQYNQVPEKARKHIETLLFCQYCNKLYWNGSHVKHMYEKLQGWQQKYH